MIVLRKCPTWKALAMLGEEYSMTSFLPFPDVFVPYSGSFDAVLYVRSCTCVSTRRNNVEVLQVKCKKALSWTTFATHSFGWNYEILISS